MSKGKNSKKKKNNVKKNVDKKILLVFWFREQMVAQVRIKGMLGLF